MPPNLNPPRLQLPPLNNILNRPTQLDDDPSVADVRNAIRYEKEAHVARADNLLDDAGLVDGVVFKTNVVLARAGNDGAAPPWFHTAMAAALAPITERLDGIDGRLDGIDGHLDRIEERLTRIDCTQAITSNRGAARGEARPFIMVPLLDGSDPTTDGHACLLLAL